jgi:hypothetical protein
MSFALGFPSTLSPTDHFNRLSAEEKGHVLSSGLGAGLLQSGLDFAVPLWWLLDDRETGLCLRNGSAFLADLGRGPIGITAAHVYREYLAAKRASVSIGCQLGSALIEPETRLICCRDDLDIATFRMSASEVEQIGKSVASHGPPQWAPLNPAVGNFLCGFPGTKSGPDSNRGFRDRAVLCDDSHYEHNGSSDRVSFRSGEGDRFQRKRLATPGV